MPGSRMSPAYWALPVTFSTESRRRKGLPITLNSDGLFNAGLSLARLAIVFPWASSP